MCAGAAWGCSHPADCACGVTVYAVQSNAAAGPASPFSSPNPFFPAASGHAGVASPPLDTPDTSAALVDDGYDSSLDSITLEDGPNPLKPATPGRRAQTFIRAISSGGGAASPVVSVAERGGAAPSGGIGGGAVAASGAGKGTRETGDSEVCSCQRTRARPRPCDRLTVATPPCDRLACEAVTQRVVAAASAASPEWDTRRAVG